MSFVTGRVDFTQLQLHLRAALVAQLERCPGTKAIVWDNALEGLFGNVAQYATLQDYSVVKMFPLRRDPLPDSAVQHFVFVARPRLRLMDLVAANVRRDAAAPGSAPKRYHLLFVPRASRTCLDRLERAGVRGSLDLVAHLDGGLFPFDSDLATMEEADCFRQVALDDDPTQLYGVARSICQLQALYGPIGRVWGKGRAARHVWELVGRLQREAGESAGGAPAKIDQLILIDRGVDLVTPLATQLTYEGLIDEIFGIKDCTATFPSEMFMTSEERTTTSLATERRCVILNSVDRLFADLRDKNFNAVGAYLSKEAKSISAQLDNSKEKSVAEMKIYVQRLRSLLEKKKLLGLHTAIAENIKNVTDTTDFLDILQTEQEFLNCIEVDKVSAHIETLISQAKPLVQVLRLICLQCLTSSGFKPKIYEFYKRELVQVYGLEALLAFGKLEKVGLIKLQTSSRNYTVLRKALRLTVEDTSEVTPTDISYVHSVYAPLSVRLCEQVTKKGGWKQLQDVLGLLPGPTVDESPSVGVNVSTGEAPSVALVYFIGGCTFAEISALRFLSQQEDSNVEFVVATTKLINGNTFIKSIIE